MIPAYFICSCYSFCILSVCLAVESESDESQTSPAAKRTRRVTKPRQKAQVTQRPCTPPPKPRRSLRTQTSQMSRRQSVVISEEECIDSDASSVISLLDSDADQSNETLTKLKSEILGYFQMASVDELTLIAGCSLKKAQKIIELRPYKTWKCLVRK